MAIQTINVGSAPNDGTGDPIRVAYQKCNANFLELFNFLVNGFTRVVYAGTDIIVSEGFTGSVVNLNDINTAVTYTVTGTSMTITSGATNGDILIF